MEEQPILVTVILITYSRLKSGYLAKSIQSVLRQGYKNFEFIVIDDGSIDGTKEYIRDLCRVDSRINHISIENNIGIPALVTAKGLRAANGDYVAFIFDDCEWTDDALETLVSEAIRNPDADLIYAKAEMVAEAGENQVIGRPLVKEDMENGINHIPNPSVLLKRSVFSIVGSYDPHVILKRSCDWDLWNRVIKNHVAIFVDKITAREYGGILPDSLGNSVAYSYGLVEKYTRIDRSQSLQLDVVDEYDPFGIPNGIILESEEKSELQKIVLEHLRRTGHVVEASQYGDRIRNEAQGAESYWKKLVHDNPYATHVELCLMLFAWAQANTHQKRLEDAVRTILDKDTELALMQSRVQTGFLASFVYEGIPQDARNARISGFGYVYRWLEAEPAPSFTLKETGWVNERGDSVKVQEVKAICDTWVQTARLLLDTLFERQQAQAAVKPRQGLRAFLSGLKGKLISSLR